MSVVRRKRKLLGLHARRRLMDAMANGAPLNAALKAMSIDISRPVAKGITDIIAILSYDAYYNTEQQRQYDSITPPWLENEPAVQEQPSDWVYEGEFPNGEWKQV